MGTGCEPAVIGLECHAKFLVGDPQITIRTVNDCLGHDRSHFLGHDADIGLVASVVDEAVEAKAVVEAAEKRDVVFQSDVGAPAAAATATSTASTEAAASACAHAASA